MGNSRNTQFSGFAKLLMNELLGDAGYIDVCRHGDAEAIEEMEETIARRAYDFVLHVVSNIVPNDIQQSTNQKSIAEIVETIPDMTKWPDID
jgi:hypothetical protein